MRGLRRRLSACSQQPTQVEYIHADMRQMIRTDWIPGIDPKIELDWRQDNVIQETGLANTIFGINESDRNIVFMANFGGGAKQDEQIFLWNDKVYGSGGVIHTADAIYYKERTTFTMDANSCVYRRLAAWDTKPVWSTVKMETRTAANTRPIMLLGADAGALNRCEVWLYGVKCWNGGVLEREYVPAKRGGVYGLWDKIGGKFLTSVTGVDFLGPE